MESIYCTAWKDKKQYDFNSLLFVIVYILFSRTEKGGTQPNGAFQAPVFRMEGTNLRDEKNQFTGEKYPFTGLHFYALQPQKDEIGLTSEIQ